MNIRKALISVSDKSGLVEFAMALHERGVQIISTGGTAKLIAEAGVPVVQVSDVTGFPEILSGRVKTLHPKIFGGILADVGDVTHVEDLEKGGIEPIDMVVVNLYPFDEVQRHTRDEDVLIENIDIGGVALLRAAAKNHRNVVVVCDPSDYGKILGFLDSCGDVPLHDRRMLALKAFYHTMRYDATIHRVLSELFASEKFEHLTFERYVDPQSNLEVLDLTDEKIVTLSKFDPRSCAIVQGALLTLVCETLAVGLNHQLIVSMVDLRESGGRICDLVGQILVVRNLTNNFARKIRDSGFLTVAFERVEDEEYCADVLKDRELVKFEFASGASGFLRASQIANVLVRERLVLDEFAGANSYLALSARMLPLYAVVGKTEDGYSFVELDTISPSAALKRLVENHGASLRLVATNGPVDAKFRNLCEANSLEIIR